MKNLKFLLLLVCGCNLFSEEFIKPNIVFMLIDDQGWVDLQGFNEFSSDYYITPNIAQLANESVRFTQAYVEPVCAPTRADIMTGMYPSRHHMYTVSNPKDNFDKHQLGRRENEGNLDTKFTTVADALTANGYRCASIGKWHLGGGNVDDPTSPTSRGFERNIGGNHDGMPSNSQWWSDSYGEFTYPNLGPTRTEADKIPDGEETDYLSDRLTDEAVLTMEDFKNSPFFIYLPHYGIHAPLQAPQSDKDVYDGRAADPDHPDHDNVDHAAMIHSIDRSVEKIMTYLKGTDDPRNPGHKLIDNTMFVYLTDNGSVTPRTDNLPLRSGKASPYDGGVRVPLMVRWQNNTGECKALVHAVDWFKTLVDFAGGDPATYENDGYSLMPLIRGEQQTLDRAVFRHQPVHVGPGLSSTIYKGDYKLLYFYESPGSTYNGIGYYEFYNLKDDIGEANNLAAGLDLTQPVVRSSMPEEFFTMADELNTWLTETEAALPYLVENGAVTSQPVSVPQMNIVDSIPSEDPPEQYYENFDTATVGSIDAATGFTSTNGLKFIGGTAATSNGQDIGASIVTMSGTNFSGNSYHMLLDIVDTANGENIYDSARHIDIILPIARNITELTFYATRTAAVNGRIAVQYSSDDSTWYWADGSIVTYSSNQTTPPASSVLEMPSKNTEYQAAFTFAANPANVKTIRLVTDYTGAVTNNRDLYIDELTIKYEVPVNKPVNSEADIHTAAGWSFSGLPTESEPGLVDQDCFIKKSADHVTASDIAYTIKEGVTVTRGSNSGRIDFGGTSSITINGTLDLFAQEDGVTTSRWANNTTITVNAGGTLKLLDTTDTADPTLIIIRDSSHLNVQGGTVNVSYLRVEDDASQLTVASGSLVAMEQEFDAVGGIINISEKSTGAIDIAAHIDVPSAQTYWNNLWITDKLCYNGQNYTALSNPAFSNYFTIDNTTFALKVSETKLTPALGMELQQTGTLLTWTVAEEHGTAKYEVRDIQTGELIKTVMPTAGQYSVDLPEGVDAKVVVIDTSGFAQNFLPADGNIVKVEYALSEGWNLIAMPGENADINELNSIALGELWKWNGHSYEITDIPQPGEAFWIYTPQQSEIIIEAEKIPATLPLSSGWNMVGPTENMVIPSEIQHVYGWKKEYQNISTIDGMLIQGIGYWLYKAD